MHPTNATVEHTREYTLGYDMAALACNARHAPVRLLTSIQQSAWGTNAPIVALPPVTFSYNRLERTFDDTTYTSSSPPWLNFARSDSVSTGERSANEWPSIREMMLDFDGDGLVDRIALVPDANECRFHWQKNLGRNTAGGFNFGIPVEQTMPRLPWANGTRGPDESCTLNYQFTKRGNILDPVGPCEVNNGTYLAYRWTDITGDGLVDLVAAIHHDAHYDPNTDNDPSFFQHLRVAGWGSCSGDGGSCPVPSSACVHDALVCEPDEGCRLHHPSLSTCLSEAPIVTCDRLMKGMDQHGPTDADQNEIGPIWPDGHTPPSGNCSEKKEHLRCDRFPWFVHENVGGALEPQGEVKYQPIPLESDSGDSSIGGGGSYSSTAHALQDMDGDGYMDVVVRGKPLEGNAGYPPIWWLVFRGDGSGGFHVDDSGYPYLWYVPENAHINGACPATAGSLCATPPASTTDGTVSGYSSLVDLNGDGAVDYAWSHGSNLETDGFWNNGLSFSGHGPGSPPQGDYVGAGLLSRSWVHATERVEPWDTPANWLITGWRQSHSHLVDVDDDGRPDLIESPLTNYTTTPWPTSLRFNDGGTFLAPLDLNQLPNLQSGLMQRTEATGYLGDSHWSVKWELVDMDGDGLPEQWKFPLDEYQNIAVRRDTDTQPLRLLKRIDNGRGGAVEVVYASTNDPGDTVTQDASVRKALPRTQWVVESLSIRDLWEDTSKTAYKYELPVWKADERGRFGFRGFERVRTYAPSNALTIDDYDYAVDWSGRLARSRTFSQDDYANPKSIAETDWEPRALFGGAITTYHAIRERKWTCNNGQSEASCMASNVGRVETITELEPLPLASPQMHVAKNVYTTTSGTYQAGDRRRKETLGLVSDADDYRVQTTNVTEYAIPNVYPFVEETTRKIVNTFDSTHRVQETSDVHFTLITDPYDHHHAVTTWTYDMSTGVKLTTRSPNNHSTTLVESYVYDPTKRFVTTTTNEKGHAVHREYHSGTGALLTEFGPNSVWCGWGCVAWEQTWTDIDGLGRPVASWVNREAAGGWWLRTQVGRYKYVDHVASGARTNVETGTLIEYDSDRWTNEKTELDGLGRPDIVTVTTGGAANAVTTYDYDHRGHLVAVTLPDPSQNNASTVTYTYGYDSLGRPTSMRRPAVGGPTASGIDLSYDGLLHSRTEVAGSQGGPSARTDLVHDAFGRLLEVREFTSGTAYASTEYKYDANDNVRSIRNPESVITELFHDFEGRRTKIIRNGRTWKYGYWPGGELKFETAHHGNGWEAQYTTSYAYDELGREKSRSVGTRNLTGTDPQQLGVGQISFGYDACTNGIGRLCMATHPFGVLTSSFAYDAEGNPTLETRTFKFAGFEASRTSRMLYGPGGRVVTQTYADHSLSPYDGTVARFEYDDRALPRTIKWQNGSALRTVANQARNTAGLVTVRHTNFGATGWNESQSEWIYDPLTRVKSQQVVQGQNGLAVELAKQELDYFGQDDPSRLKHWMRRSATQTSYYDMSFGYDQRHQLATVSEAANKFSAYYWFSPSGKLSSAWIGGNPPAGHEVVPRWVTYVYGASNNPGTEPDAPIGLQDFWTGTYTRSYSYDTAGNMVSRSGGGTPLESYAYDGEDQLRRASSSNGIEEYFYDHTGNRAGIVRRNSSNTVTEVRVFMGDAEVVYYPSGAISKTFAHLSLGTPVARITNRTDIELQYHGLSNNTLVSVAPNGTTRSAFVHAPYGELLESVGTALPDQHRRFNDKYRDDLTKLSYYGVRYYDGVMLGWTQADPLYRFVPDEAWTEPRRAGLYIFSLHNPVRYLDPDGRHPIGVLVSPPVAGAAATGAAAGTSQPKVPTKQQTKTIVKVLGTSLSVPLVGGAVIVGAAIVKATSGSTTQTSPRQDPPEGCKDPEVPTQLPMEQLIAPPPARGLAPIGLDGMPVELHHPDQQNGAPYEEKSQTDHRGKGNYKKNHSNTGQSKSKVDRKAFKQKREAYWKQQWDCGRFEELQEREKKEMQQLLNMKNPS